MITQIIVRLLVFLGRAKRKLRKTLFPGQELTAAFLTELTSVLGGNKLNAVDVGGAVDLQPHWRKMIGSANFYIFEPHPESYEALVRQAKTRPYGELFHFLMTGLSGKGGKRTLYMTNAPTGSTILPLNRTNPYIHDDSPGLFPMREKEIETMTLKAALEKVRPIEADLIKLDTQGADLEILEGFGKEGIDRLLCVEMEVNLHHYFVGGTTLSNAAKFMDDHGFEFFDFRIDRGFVQRNGKRDFSRKHFDVDAWSPSVAAKAWEFDVICFRKPAKILQSRNPDLVRRLIACYCVYNFFFEAIELAEEAKDLGIITSEDFAAIRKSVLKMKTSVHYDLGHWSSLMKGQQSLNWGQYIWMKYPST